MNESAWRRLGAMVACAWLVAGCGGGGGGDTPPAADTRPPPAASHTESFPTGDLLPTGGREYLPFAQVGRWVYERQADSGTRLGDAVITSTPGVAGQSTVTEVADGTTTTTDYRWTTRGWEFDGQQALDLPPATAEVLSSLLLYPVRFTATSMPAVQSRRGSLGEDLDGDGVDDGVDVSVVQYVFGQEMVASPGGPVLALRVRTTVTLTLLPSDYTRYVDLTIDFQQTEWLVEGVGPVRIESTYSANDGSASESEVWTLRSVTVDGVDPFTSGRFPVSRVVPLPNEDVVADRARGVYYASVPATDPTRGNRIATIAPDTGEVTLSAPVGSSPGAMALSADGQSLFVALDGSGELLQLRLPGMTEVARHRLPVVPFYGQLLAESIAPSPTEADTVAISLMRPGISPKHAGVVLLRQGELQPRMTQDHTGSNLVAFDATGTRVFGFNNETTEFGLRQLAVQSDGLVEETVVNAGGGFYISALDRIGNLLVFGNRAHGTDLSARGTLAGARYCRGLSATRIACLNDDFGTTRAVLVFEAATFTQVAALPWAGTEPLDHAVLEPGTTGQVALRDGIQHPAHRTAQRLVLLSQDALP